MASFNTQAVTKALWPEVTGVIAYGTGVLGAAWADTYFNKGTLIQQSVTYGSLIAGIGLVGMGRNVDFGKGLIFGSGVGLLLQLMQTFYNSILPAAAVAKPTMGALIPRTLARRPNPAQITSGAYKRPAPVVAGRGAMVRGTY